MKNKYSIEQLIKKLKSSEEFMKNPTDRLNSVNSVFMNRKPKIDENLAIQGGEICDNTLVSYIRKTPKQFIQKIPDFKVDTIKYNKADDLFYEFVLKRYIVGNGAEGYSTLQNHWITATNAMAYGTCAVAMLPVLVDDELKITYDIIHHNDLFPEPYSANINEANWLIFRIRMTEDTIQDIIDASGKSSYWRTSALKELLDYRGESESGTYTEDQEKQDRIDNLYEVFIYTDKKKIIHFSPKIGKILRQMDNLSGYKLYRGMIIDPNGFDFFGNSLIDLGYEAQQVLTALWRSVLRIYDYNSDPTVLFKGAALNKEKGGLEKGKNVHLNNEDGSVDPVFLDTSILATFTNLVRLAQAKLISCLPASTDTSISAEVGDVGYSKTQAGVNNQTRQESIEMNYYRKNYEAFVERYYEAALNLYLAERQAEKTDENGMYEDIVIRVNDEYANKIKEEDSGYLKEDNSRWFKYDRRIKLQVDFDSSRSMVKEENMKHLTGFMASIAEVIKTNDDLANTLDNIMPLIMKAMVRNSELEDGAEIIKAIDEALQERKAERELAEQMQLQDGVSSDYPNQSVPDYPIEGGQYE